MCHLALIFGGESALGLGPAVCEAAQERRIAHGMTSLFFTGEMGDGVLAVSFRR